MEKIQFGPKEGETEAALYGLAAGEKYRFFCRSGAGALQFESTLFKIEESKVSDREKEAPVISLEFANGVTIQARTSYGLYFYRKLSPLGEKPSRPEPFLCISCGQPCISKCSCGAYVHQSFGYTDVNCSGLHELSCEAARKSRVPEKPIPIGVKPMYDSVPIKRKAAKKKSTKKPSRKKVKK